MKVFKSLNCIVCRSPFAPIANQPRTPRLLRCGKAMCHSCFEREKSTANEERKHQCEYGKTCFYHPGFDYFLINLLSQDSLKLSPMGEGYLLCKPLKCPFCQDQYSNVIWGKSPARLFNCNHIICARCYETKKTRLFNGASNEDWGTYQIKCPLCLRLSLFKGFNQPERITQVLNEFLTELPEMTRQLEEMSTTARRFCKECKREQPVKDMFYCRECQKNICGTCGFKRHQSHRVSAILEMKVEKFGEQPKKLSMEKINDYLELLKELVGDIGTFRTKLLSKEQNLKMASIYQDLRKEHEKCFQKKMVLEAICEEYIPHLRECDAIVKDLIKSFDDDTN